MSRIASILLAILTIAGTANADKFKLVYGQGEESYSLSYSKVAVAGAQGEELFAGYTDKYGRISIDLPAGEYSCSVYYREKTLRAKIVIDGSSELKRIDRYEPTP